MNVILEYVIMFIPTIVAIVSEIGVIAAALSTLKKAKETQEFKNVVEQNKLLVQELRESKKLNKELLTKIDRIHRGE